MGGVTNWFSCPVGGAQRTPCAGTTERTQSTESEPQRLVSKETGAQSSGCRELALRGEPGSRKLGHHGAWGVGPTVPA